MHPIRSTKIRAPYRGRIETDAGVGKRRAKCALGEEALLRATLSRKSNRFPPILPHPITTSHNLIQPPATKIDRAGPARAFTILLQSKHASATSAYQFEQHPMLVKRREPKRALFHCCAAG